MPEALPFARVPTPVRRLGGLWVKDEGEAGVPYGGNKVRKLGYLLARAQRDGVTDLVTSGAIGSHHVIATATFAAELGIRTHAVLFPQPPTAHVRANARLIAERCASLRVVPDWLRGGIAVARRVARLRLEGHAPRVLPVGGSSALGTLGWLDAGVELAAQVREGELPLPARVYVPFATGGTAAGLWAGFAVAGLDVEVVAVRVVSRVVANRARLSQLAGGALRLRGSSAPLGRLRIASGWYCDGYGRFDRRIEEAVAMGRDGGLPVETTYGGKALAACLAEHDGAEVLFVQTASVSPSAAGDRPLPTELEALLR